MAWTAPRTWVSSEVVTASHMNTHIRDNFLETAAATAAAANDLVIADGANSMGTRLALGGNQRWLFSDGSNLSYQYHSLLDTTLTDDAATTFDTYQQWGTEQVRSTTPAGESVRVHATLSGYASVDGAGAAQDYDFRSRIRISLDDGSTWDNGQGNVHQAVDTPGYEKTNVGNQHFHSGAVTTAVVVQAQLYESDTGNTVGDTDFLNGLLVVNIMPD